MAGTWKETESSTKNDVTTKTFTYTDSATNKVVATLSGISGDAKVVDGAIAGITVGEGTIGLANEVLTNANVKLQLSNGGKYALTFVGTVEKVKATDITATASGGTVTLTGKTSKGYELTNATTVTYVKAQGNQKLVTITGLNTNLGFTNGKIGYTPEGGSFTEYVTYDATTGNVTLKEGALAGKNVKLALNYAYSPFKNLALDGVPAPELSGSWDYGTKGKAIFKGTVETGGYRLALDGKNLAYTAKNDNSANLVTISGVKEPAEGELTGISSTTSSATNNATITLPAAALNQAAVSVAGTGYVLALDSTTDPVPTSDVPNKDIWAISGTKAIYKTVKPEYYTYDASTNKVTYTKQKDVATLATLNGTKKITGDVTAETVEEGLKVKDGVITVGSVALGTSNLTLVNGKDSNGTASTYTLALNENDDIDEPDITSDGTTWKVSGTTATLTGKSTAGWAKSNDTTITYVADGKTINLATVKGLAKGIALGKTGSAWEGKVGIAGKDANGDYTFTEGLSEEDGVITVSKNVLGTTNVTVTPAAGYSYSLALDKDSTNAGGAVPTKKETKHFWYVQGKKLLLKTGDARYYTLSSDGQTIMETDEVVGKDVATVTGLKTGLKVVDGDIAGITVTGQLITVSEDVLNKANVSVTSTDSLKPYTLALASNDLTRKDGTIWNINGTNASLYYGKTEGYTPSGDNKTLTYGSATNQTLLAEITGLKSGLKVVNGKIDGIADSKFDSSAETADKTITLSNKVLGTTDVTLINYKDSHNVSYNYELAVDSTVSPIEVNRNWDTNGTTATYSVETKKAGFEAVKDEDDKVVQLAYKKAGTVKTTITNLGDGISSNDFDDAGPDENGVITLSEDVLGTKNATLKNASGGTYTLALADPDSMAPKADDIAWVPDTKNKTKATLQGKIGDPGWEISADKLSVVYTPASEGDNKDILATVTGLKSGLTAEELETGIARVGNVLTLKDSVLGAAKLTVSGGTYTLAIANEESTKAYEVTGWVTSGTTANFKTYKTGYYTPDAKGTTVKYTKPTAGTTYATVKGIAKNVDITNAYKPDSLTITKGGEVKLTVDMLGTSNVTLTGSGFKLELAEGVPTSANNVTEWVTNGTTATYKKYDKAYYTKSGNTIKYTKPTAGNTIATIKGIASGATIELSNISTDGTNNTIVTLNKNQLAGKKVTISGSGYLLALGGDVPEAEPKGTYWTQAKNAAAAIYKEDFSGGYTLANAKNAITYSANPTVTTLATVSGLAKNTGDAIDTRGGNADEGYTYEGAAELESAGLRADGKGIIVYEAAFPVTNGAIKNNAKITLKDNSGQGYTLTNGMEEPAEKSLPEWTLNKNKGTAVYTQDYTAGATLSDDKKTLTYTEAKEDNKAVVLATISGLDKTKLKEIIGDTEVTDTVDDGELATKYGIQVNDTTIKLLNKNVLGTSNITLGKKDLFAFDISAVVPVKNSTDKWAVNGTTATYNQITSDGYTTTDTNVVKYVKEAVGDNIFTITGLKKGLKVSKDGSKIGLWDNVAKDVATSRITISPAGKSVSLTTEVLGTTDIELINGENQTYHFSNSDINPPGAPENVWTFKGGTATYKTIQNSGFTLAAGEKPTKITYTAAKNVTLATVKGLNKTFTGNLNTAIVADDANETITVNGELLGTSNVTLTLPRNASAIYSLTIGSGVEQGAVHTDGEWVTSGTTATYKAYDKAYYTTDPTTGAIIYHKPTAGTTYATIKGIKSGATIATTDFAGNKDGGTVTLSAKQLGTSNVTVSVPNSNKSAEFKLALASDVVSGTATGWVTTGTKAVFKQDYDKPTYTINEKGAIVYKAGTNKGTEIATITGANGDLDNATFEENTFSLTSDGLGTKISLATTATTAGVSDYAFNFNTTYNNAAITGSANADTITVAGDRLSITGGKGNDEITLGTAPRSGNTIVYSTGDGDDTIINFQEKDALQIKGFKVADYTGGTTINVGTGNNAGKIELEGYTGNSITINGKSYSTDPGAYSNVLLADDNYSMEAANLSSLVQADISSYTPYDFDGGFGLTKEDKLTPQISYSGNDK